MKKILFGLLIIITVLTTIPTQAANYNFKELIPVDIETTIVGEKISYRRFYYNVKKNEDKTKKNNIIFGEIKNISDETIQLSFSIALFGENRKNIGTINYCDKTLAPGQTIQLDFPVTKEYLGDEYQLRDVKYISMLSENLVCRKTGAKDYIGQTIEKIGVKKNGEITSPVERTFKVYIVIGGLLLALFLYAFMFTNQYQNENGDDVRRALQYENEEEKRKRDAYNKAHPTPPEEPEKIKTDTVLQQEQAEKEKNKEDNDLQNMY